MARRITTLVDSFNKIRVVTFEEQKPIKLVYFCDGRGKQKNFRKLSNIKM